MAAAPKMKTPNYQNIPQELKDIPNWVNWKYCIDPNRPKPSKLPLNATGVIRGAKQNDRTTWTSFEKVCENVSKYPELGIGFELGESENPAGYMCIDLDHVLTNGQITDPAAKEIFETLDSYTEITPGGDGLHIWIRADVTEDRRKRKGVIEIYSSGRYITVTGYKFGNRETIEQRTPEIIEIINKYLNNSAADPRPAAAPIPQGEKITAPSSVGSSHNTKPAPGLRPWGLPAGSLPNRPGDSDTDIIRKMTAANLAAARLWRGDFSNYPSQSEADQALINHLAYWTNYDPAATDRLFRQSGLMRPKWDVKHSQGKTYGQITIDKAMTGNSPRPAAAPIPQGEKITAPSSVGSLQQTRPGAALYQAAGIDQTQQQTPQEDVYNYSAAQLRTDFEDMILIKTPRISTGFPYLNQLLDGGLYPSLITLGAITSTGKTTLGLQIMDNIAAAGTDVIIFSLEMSRFELIAKSISRLSFKLAEDKKDAFTTRQLLDYDSYQRYTEDRVLLIEKSKQEYFDKIAPHVFIRQSPVMGMGVDKIRDALQSHADQTGAAPVVLVDYIQLMTPPENNRRNMTDKQVIDNNVMSLKQISRDFNTPVIGISSVNRAAYSYQAKKDGKTKIDLTDFKESGAIEFSSDILLGLNLDVYDDKNKTGKMSLDILKNRNGAKGTTQNFDYYYAYNCFVENNLTATVKP